MTIATIVVSVIVRTLIDFILTFEKERGAVNRFVKNLSSTLVLSIAVAAMIHHRVVVCSQRAALERLFYGSWRLLLLSEL